MIETPDVGVHSKKHAKQLPVEDSLHRHQTISSQLLPSTPALLSAVLKHSCNSLPKPELSKISDSKMPKISLKCTRWRTGRKGSPLVQVHSRKSSLLSEVRTGPSASLFETFKLGPIHAYFCLLCPAPRWQRAEQPLLT